MGTIATMQLITNVSKFFILAVLSCSLLIAWDYGKKEIASVSGFTDTDESSIFFPSDSIWSSIREEFELDHRTQSAQVQAEIRRLQADRGKLYHTLQAAAPYIYFIHKQTRAHGLPAEIALIPVIESEFNPNDRSKRGASGLWQLMPGTAHDLGIQVKSGYDGRRDVIASTKAALAYFKGLGENFNGDWYLAIAAYNCGQGKMASVTRHNSNDNFWNLPLPQETKHYVPKLLAIAAIVENPKKYGVQLPPIDNKPYFAELRVNKAVNLVKIAKSAGVSMKTLHMLNPDYDHRIVPKQGAYTILVPVNKVPDVKAHLHNIVSS